MHRLQSSAVKVYSGKTDPSQIKAIPISKQGSKILGWPVFQSIKKDHSLSSESNFHFFNRLNQLSINGYFIIKKTKGIKSHISNLVAIAKSDGNFSIAEKRLIFDIAKKTD